MLARTFWNKYAQSYFLVYLVFFFFLPSLQDSISPRVPAAHVTPFPCILRSSLHCLACLLATLYFLCWCCTLFSACLTLSESLHLASILALSLTGCEWHTEWHVKHFTQLGNSLFLNSHHKCTVHYFSIQIFALNFPGVVLLEGWSPVAKNSIMPQSHLTKTELLIPILFTVLSNTSTYLNLL